MELFTFETEGAEEGDCDGEGEGEGEPLGSCDAGVWCAAGLLFFTRSAHDLGALLRKKSGRQSDFALFFCDKGMNTDLTGV